MKYYSILVIITAFSVFYISCKRTSSDSPEAIVEVLKDTSFNAPEDDIEIMPLVEEPPKKPEDVARQQVNEDRSPFKDTGCCADETRRIQQDCCCLAVLESYKIMLEEADFEKLAVLMLKDPILGDCRDKMKKAFEALENPPVEDEDLI